MIGQPKLCPACFASIVALSLSDPRPELMRYCEHNLVLAWAFKRNTGEIQRWELHGPLSDRELVHEFAERISEAFADGRLAGRRTDPS